MEKNELSEIPSRELVPFCVRYSRNRGWARKPKAATNVQPAARSKVTPESFVPQPGQRSISPLDPVGRHGTGGGKEGRKRCIRQRALTFTWDRKETKPIASLPRTGCPRSSGGCSARTRVAFSPTLVQNYSLQLPYPSHLPEFFDTLPPSLLSLGARCPQGHTDTTRLQEPNLQGEAERGAAFPATLPPPSISQNSQG